MRSLELVALFLFATLSLSSYYGIVDAAAVITVTDYPTQFYAGQDIPVPPLLSSGITRLGCASVLSGSGQTQASLAVDLSTMRLVALVSDYNAATGRFNTDYSMFIGDTIYEGSGFLQATNDSYGIGTSCPICLSYDANLLAMGGWITSPTINQNSNSSVIIAQRSGNGDYQFLTRLFSGLANTTSTRRFAYDMVCTGGFEYIKISEPAIDNTTLAVLTTYTGDTTTGQYPTPFWEMENTFVYAPGNSNLQRTMRLTLAGNEVYYAIKQSNETIEIRYVEDDSLEQSFYIGSIALGNDILGISLNYEGTRLVFTVQGTIFPGETYIYAVERTEAAGGLFDINSAVGLTDPANVGYSSWGAGASLSFIGAPGIDALLVGMPGYPIDPRPSLFYPQTGAISIWRACPVASPTNSSVNETFWLPGQKIFKPFVPGTPVADGMGSSFTSHNVWSPDGSFAIVSSPMNYYTSEPPSSSTGRVSIFKQILPVCTAAPTTTPVATPTGSAPVDNPPLGMAIIILVIVVFTLFFAGITLLVTKWNRSKQ